MVKKYLIVEDDFSSVAVLKKAIEKIGYDVHVLYPLDAISFNRKEKPEVVQFDGLGSACFNWLPKFKLDNPDAEFLVYSGDDRILERAKKEGIMAFEKNRYSGNEALVEHLKNSK